MAVRLVASPLAGRIGDHVHSLRGVLVVCLAAAAAAALGFLPAHGVALILPIALAYAAALAPAGVLSDALALEAASGRSGPKFEYGRVRGAGSAAFIVGTLVSGQVVGATGLVAILPMQCALLVLAALVALRVPEARPPAGTPRQRLRDALRVLLRISTFRNAVLAATLVLGSHALHDAFAMIRWNEAGIAPATASLLWSESVVAEVIVFFVAGPILIARITPAGAIALAALAGALRWSVMAQTSEVAILALIQPLHGLTFALLHLACMRLLAQSVPAGLEGTAQAIYATIGVGTATTLLTLASGTLYGHLGAHAFFFMAVLCALALPVAWAIKKGQSKDHPFRTAS
jgi:PPP family 3-phenylpropionic acid transporter